MRNVKLSWLVFLIIGGGMFYLRYKGGLSGAHLDDFIKYGPYAVLVLHIALCLMAFQDSVFQGILCLFVPLYSFYWLFLISDAFMFRAIVAGIFVGVGQDSLAFYQEWFNAIVETGKGWIESGGGDIDK